MTSIDQRSADELRRLQEAAVWRVRLTEDGVGSSEAFETWRADAGNAAAFDEIDEPWRRMGEEGASPEAISARVGALQRARRSGRRRWRARSGIWKAVAAIGVIGLLLGAFVGWRWTDARPLVYETGMGERRVVQLADGSTVSLDSSSEVRVRYSADARSSALSADRRGSRWRTILGVHSRSGPVIRSWSRPGQHSISTCWAPRFW